MERKRGLFVGMTTLDCLYQVARSPAANEKVTAHKSLLVSGGPATNAAVAFAQLGASKRQSGRPALHHRHPSINSLTA